MYHTPQPTVNPNDIDIVFVITVKQESESDSHTTDYRQYNELNKAADSVHSGQMFF